MKRLNTALDKAHTPVHTIQTIELYELGPTLGSPILSPMILYDHVITIHNHHV